MSFSVTTKELKRVDLVQVTGRVDSATAPQLEQALQKTIDAGRYNIVVDLAEAEYMSSAALRALISGDAPFDLSDSDEFIEGRVAGLDHGVVRKLRRGEFAVQGHVDLHGLTRDEAKREVDRFLRAARQGGKRCVLVVHGRGLHSKDQLPVLKEALRSWLGSARLGRHVLAFATARPVDGGAGAIYVLLRRPGR